MPLSHVIKAIHNAYGSTLLSPEFMDKFYTVFFTLSSESEKRFADIDKQKKALHGMLHTLEQIAEDKEVFSKVQGLKEKHKDMKITPGIMNERET